MEPAQKHKPDEEMEAFRVVLSPTAASPDDAINLRGALSPFEAHVAYEKSHPFMDGNGRSGRAIWAWMMQREGLDPYSLQFLHRWYYQSLNAARPTQGSR